MQQPDRDQTIQRFNQLFGHGWRRLYADAIGLGYDTLTVMKGPTLKHAAALADFFECTPPQKWPRRFTPLKEKRLAKVKADAERNKADDHERTE